MWVHVCAVVSVEVRGHLEDISSIFHVGSGDRTYILGFGGKCSYPLSCLTSSQSGHLQWWVIALASDILM